MCLNAFIACPFLGREGEKGVIMLYLHVSSSARGETVSSQNSCAEVLPPGPQIVTLFGNKVIADVVS